MSNKNVMEIIAGRLRAIRKALSFNSPRFARQMGCSSTTAYRYENAQALPGMMNCRKLGVNLGISLDWLILGRGEMLYSETQGTKNDTPGNHSEELTESVLMQDGLREDIKELLSYMEAIPQLRYDVLSAFHKFKQDNKELVSTAMNKL